MATLVRLLLVLLSYVAITAHSAELGVVGPTYEITEPDLIEVIQSRLKRMEKSGELGRKQNEYRDRVIGGIEKPNAVSGINATQTPRTFYVDPTLSLIHISEPTRPY